MMIEMIKQLYPHKNLLWDHLPEIPYQTAMDLYGCDKPDLRFELQMSDITHIVRYTNFNIFRKPIEN
jgi:aspartyl-tRNA synthetase